MTIYEKLFNYYKKLQSQEMQSEIQGYKPMKIKNTKVAIKVTFKDGDWIRVYENIDGGSVEWY
ncbi:hypothetical protein [Clostridium guangxiense]|uniref:hypothetical protein n=1 Tax=Clostridium guangxiense TaxID=1662055 RepID=UPI001E554DF7|nr:hypothetical protein [Clostridium guangxiense]MCD2346248.1 hypothetical protein [Clostridium guangxiense]